MHSICPISFCEIDELLLYGERGKNKLSIHTCETSTKLMQLSSKYHHRYCIKYRTRILLSLDFTRT